LLPALCAEFEGRGLVDSGFSQLGHKGYRVDGVRQEVDAGLNAFAFGNQAGNGRQCDTVDPVVAAGVEHDASFQRGASACGAAHHVNHQKSSDGQAISPEYAAEQPNA
jgi:hypothetical protein